MITLTMSAARASGQLPLPPGPDRPRRGTVGVAAWGRVDAVSFLTIIILIVLKLTQLHQQTGVLLYHIILLYYTHYDTIIFHYDTIISLIFLQMSGLLFFIISLSPKRTIISLYDTSIISLIFIRIFYCNYGYYYTII